MIAKFNCLMATLFSVLSVHASATSASSQHDHAMNPQASASSSTQGQIPLPLFIDQHIKPLMQSQQIPGMAVAVLWHGQTYLYAFGQADIASQRPVTADTLFEVGSVTKTFNGVLSAMALARGDIKLTDPVQKYWPELTGSAWQQIQLVHLATYTAGGLPLQFPDSVQDEASMRAFYRQWQPRFAPGEQRVYANTSIGLFGHLAQQHRKQPYGAELQQQLLTPLQLTHTYTQVPQQAIASYAFGYDEGKAVRSSRGMLSDEAGGIKMSMRDLAHWLDVQLDPSQVNDPVITQAFALAQQRYASAGQMYQGLGWEMLDYPVSLTTLKAMTDPSFVGGAKAHLIQPATAANARSWVHKTGSTGGFAAYVAMIPAERAGIVLLANKRYANALRVTVAHQVLNGLIEGSVQAP